jgi:DNA mismatch endonuclease (patch repair protein)
MRRNAERDRRSTELAQDLGWKVIRVWECEVKDDPSSVAQRILSVGDTPS